MLSWSWSAKLFRHTHIMQRIEFRCFDPPSLKEYVFSNRGWYVVVDLFILAELIHVRTNFSTCSKIHFWGSRNYTCTFLVEPVRDNLEFVFFVCLFFSTCCPIVPWQSAPNLVGNALLGTVRELVPGGIVVKIWYWMQDNIQHENKYLKATVVYPGSGLQGASTRFSFSLRTTFAIGCEW